MPTKRGAIYPDYVQVTLDDPIVADPEPTPEGDGLFFPNRYFAPRYFPDRYFP